MTDFSKRWRYYLAAIVLIAVGSVILLSQNMSPVKALLGISIFSSGIYFLWIASPQERDKQKNNLPEDEGSFKAHHRNIYTQGGAYNESVQGDCIIIQGNQIYINQDPSQFIVQLQEVFSQLQGHGYSYAVAEQKILKDLKNQIRNNQRVKNSIIHWRETLESPSGKVLNVIELAEKAVKIASTDSSRSIYDPILVVEGKYQKLYDFLREGDWREADRETLNIILDSIARQGYHGLFGDSYGCLFLNIDQISPKMLKMLDRLWNKYSNGRFGFSVQQCIWRHILRNHPKDEYLINQEAYIKFIDSVGWVREEDRIYYNDFKFSLKAPKGHFPALLFLDSPISYYHPSNYYHLDARVFDGFMQRQYHNVPAISSWLKQWLAIE